MRFLSLIRVNCIVVIAALLSTVCHAAPWFPLGPFGGSARSLVADPADPKHLFLGTATGWIYDSHDGGTNWTRVAQIANRNDLVVDNIVVDRRNPKRLMVAAFTADHLGDGGIFISEDGGKNWYSQAEMRGQSIRALARADSDANVLVAGTLKGVFRSKDNGIHWKQISPQGSAEIHEVQSIAIDPTDPNVIYAGTWHLPWKTIDGGATWHNIKRELSMIQTFSRSLSTLKTRKRCLQVPAQVFTKAQTPESFFVRCKAFHPPHGARASWNRTPAH